MGVESKQFYVNNISLTIWDNGTQKSFNYKDDEINQDIFNNLKNTIDENKLTRIELENIETDLGMTVFCENSLSHFGIVDMYNDINYYYDNETGDKALVGIDGQLFEKWMVCEDKELLYDTIIFFAINGKTNPQIKWVEE